MLRRKREFYAIACSHTLTSQWPGSSQSKQEGIREMAASFLRGRGCPTAVAAKPKSLRLSGNKGASLGYFETQHNPFLKLGKRPGKVMETN